MANIISHISIPSRIFHLVRLSVTEPGFFWPKSGYVIQAHKPKYTILCWRVQNYLITQGLMKEKVSVLLKYELEDHAGPEIPMAIFAATWNEPANIKL